MWFDIANHFPPTNWQFIKLISADCIGATQTPVAKHGSPRKSLNQLRLHCAHIRINRNIPTKHAPLLHLPLPLFLVLVLPALLLVKTLSWKPRKHYGWYE